MIRLITNSDDFGLTKSITDAIIDTHLNGIMTSTTLMANMEGTDYAIQKAKEISTLGVGIHFNLTEGKPLTEPNKIPHLIDPNGFFKKNSEQRKNFLYGKEKIKQAELELKNQLECILDHGLVPTHFDSHHHITGTPVAFKASMSIGQKYHIGRARITNTNFRYIKGYEDWVTIIKNRILTLPKMIIHNQNKKKLNLNHFITPDYKVLPSRVLPVDKNYVQQFINTLSVLKQGVTEISFHPGYENSYYNDSETMLQIRLRDLEIAKSDIVKNYIKDNHIQLISFREL